MFTPEVQRLREIRLCNINSLCITGSSNTSRFEHSVGTAYLAMVNINSDIQKHLKLTSADKETFIIAALLHDVANGPFGHSYEYIMEKKGFVPEKGLREVLTGVSSVGEGAHKNKIPFETFFFDTTRALSGILNNEQIEKIDTIIEGNDPLSKLISNSIDLDNIDNVFRMAYHMGLSFRKEAPFKLATSMYIENNEVHFLESSRTYLEEWYLIRKRVYKFLLLNPQEFAGKYMLTEAMDIMFNYAKQAGNSEFEIKWTYTDYQLMEELLKQKEIWLKEKTLLASELNLVDFESRDTNKIELERTKIKECIEKIILSIPIKEKGKSGESYQISLNPSFKYVIDENNVLKIRDRNMNFEIINNNLYKVVNKCYNPSQIVSRLMTGDLYYCLAILVTKKISEYSNFIDYEKRIVIEDELNSKIKEGLNYPSLKIGIHPILDVNKTERQIEVFFEDSVKEKIGEISSKKLLIGVFLKNTPYGLKEAKCLAEHKEKKIKEIIVSFFRKYFENDICDVELYKEADEYGK